MIRKFVTFNFSSSNRLRNWNNKKDEKYLTLMAVNALLHGRQMSFNSFQSKIFLLRSANIYDDYFEDDHYCDSNDLERWLMQESLTSPTIILDPSPRRPTQVSRIKILPIQRLLIQEIIYSLYQAKQI